MPNEAIYNEELSTMKSLLLGWVIYWSKRLNTRRLPRWPMRVSLWVQPVLTQKDNQKTKYYMLEPENNTTPSYFLDPPRLLRFFFVKRI